jgi:hypothetical protein
MNSWKIKLSIFLCWIGHAALAQYTSMSIDPLGNEYRWSKSKIEKKEVNSSIVFQNNLLSFGDIQNIDFTNPFKPFIFFENSQTIVILDNTLSIQGQINLENLHLGWITQVCGSKWSGYWLWNNMEKTLIKINPQGESILQIPNLSQSYIHSSWEIRWMSENEQQLYLRDDEHFFVFDLLGGMRNCYPFLYAPTWLVDGRVMQFRENRIEELYPDIKTLGTVSKAPIYLHENGIYFSAEPINFILWGQIQP